MVRLLDALTGALYAASEALEWVASQVQLRRNRIVLRRLDDPKVPF